MSMANAKDDDDGDDDDGIINSVSFIPISKGSRHFNNISIKYLYSCPFYPHSLSYSNALTHQRFIRFIYSNTTTKHTYKYYRIVFTIATFIDNRTGNSSIAILRMYLLLIYQ